MRKELRLLSHKICLKEKRNVGIEENTGDQQFHLFSQYLLSIPDDRILDSSKLKEFADDNFKFDENGGKLSKRVENTVGKGEIARNEQFLLFAQCFQKACFLGASKGVIVWEWVKNISCWGH